MLCKNFWPTILFYLPGILERCCPLIFEFQHFLRDLLKEAKKSEEVTDDQLIEYTDTMVS